MACGTGSLEGQAAAVILRDAGFDALEGRDDRRDAGADRDDVGPIGSDEGFAERAVRREALEIVGEVLNAFQAQRTFAADEGLGHLDAHLPLGSDGIEVLSLGRRDLCEFVVNLGGDLGGLFGGVALDRLGLHPGNRGVLGEDDALIVDE